MESLVMVIVGGIVGAGVTYLFTKLTYQNLLLVKQMDALTANQKEVVQYITDYPSPEEMVEKISTVIAKTQKNGIIDLNALSSMGVPNDDTHSDTRLGAKAPDYTG